MKQKVERKGYAAILGPSRDRIIFDIIALIVTALWIIGIPMSIGYYHKDDDWYQAGYLGLIAWILFAVILALHELYMRKADKRDFGEC
jgi:hypothetical protein